MRKRRVLGITAIRSEYYLQRPIFRALTDHPEIDFQLILTGAHLSPLHGCSAREVEADDFCIVERIENLLYSDHDAARLKGSALQLSVLAHAVDKLRPDWLLIPGDREEAMAMALCGAYLGLATAHYGAGDRVVGNVDDMIRHAVSRLSHLLLTTHEGARERLIQAGEQEWRVHNVGHSGLDRVAGTAVMTDDELARALGIPRIKRPYLIVIQHPLSSEFEEAGRQMRETLEAAKELEMQTFVSYPNSDAGGRLIIEAIEEYRSQPQFHIFQTIPDAPFINLLRGATALIGNSSLGLLEAPYLHLPVINAGRRQTTRHHVDNVFFVSNDRREIVRQVRAILDDKETQRRVRECSNPFGDGHTGARVANLLASTAIDARLLNKDLSY